MFITLLGTVVNGEKYVYNDVYNEDTKKREAVIEYSSQKVWKTGDNLLKQDIPTFIFIRRTSRNKFRYAGQVRQRMVLRERSADAPLRMRFNVNVPHTATMEFPPVPNMMSGRYKQSVYNALNVTPTKGNGIQTGIVPVRWNRAHA